MKYIQNNRQYTSNKNKQLDSSVTFYYIYFIHESVFEINREIILYSTRTFTYFLIKLSQLSVYRVYFGSHRQRAGSKRVRMNFPWEEHRFLLRTIYLMYRRGIFTYFMCFDIYLPTQRFVYTTYTVSENRL